MFPCPFRKSGFQLQPKEEEENDEEKEEEEGWPGLNLTVRNKPLMKSAIGVGRSGRKRKRKRKREYENILQKLVR